MGLHGNLSFLMQTKRRGHKATFYCCQEKMLLHMLTMENSVTKKMNVCIAM